MDIVVAPADLSGLDKSLQRNADLIKYGLNIFREKKFDKVQQVNAFRIILTLSPKEYRSGPQGDLFFKFFFEHIFSESIEIYGRSYYMEAKEYTTRAIQHLKKAEAYKHHLSTDLSLELREILTDDYLEVLLSPFKDALKSQKETLLKLCLYTSLFYESIFPVVSRIKKITVALGFKPEDGQRIHQIILGQAGSLLQNPITLSKSDVLSLSMLLAQVVAKDSSHVFYERFELLDKFNNFVKNQVVTSLGCIHFSTRSFIMNRVKDLISFERADAEVVMYLAMRIIDLDGVRDEEEINTLKSLMKGLDIKGRQEVKDITEKFVEVPNISDVSSGSRLYAFLFLVEMVLADNDIHENEMSFLEEMTESIKKDLIDLDYSDDNLLYFLEVMYLHHEWVIKYPTFFKNLAGIYSRYLPNQESLIQRIICIHHLYVKMIGKPNFDIEFIKVLKNIFDLSTESFDSLKKMLLRTNHLDFENEEDRGYFKASTTFLLTSYLEKNFKQGSRDDTTFDSLSKDVNQIIQFKGFHLKNLEFVVSWL